jgi:hypothetical protein
MALGPYLSKQTGANSLFRTLWDLLRAGDIVLGDQPFCSYFDVSLLVRALRVTMKASGCRVAVLTLVTMLTDSKRDPKEAVARLYERRRSAELNLRHLQETLKLDVLRCETYKNRMTYRTVGSFCPENFDRWVKRFRA